MPTEFSGRVSAGAIAVCGALCALTVALAQEQPRLTFEVASVKQSHSSANGGGIRFTPGGLTAENAPLRFIITFAYQIRDFQLSGAPGWIESENYEISAKAAASPQPDKIRLMLQSLLEDRFKLRVRHKTEERPALLLMPVKGGIRLRDSGADCAALASENSARGRTCGSWFGSDHELVATKISMAQFAEWLSDQEERPVVDKTGYTGEFDVHLNWSRDDQADSPNAAPQILTAVQDQMGLKLESGKGPVDMLVVEHVEKPDAN